jgi:hypothetical protein
MHCPKCNGCLYLDVDINLRAVEPACLNCGWRKNVQTYVKPAEPRGRRPDNRCKNCTRDRAPGFTQCNECRLYQKDYRKRTNGRRRISSRKVTA